jgi:putative FmdB family regulatory protein
MPLYEYQCDTCGHRFEKIQKFSDPIVDTCPVCGSAVRKLQSSPAIQFKGSGFYITDYPKKDKGGEKSDGGSADNAAKSESGSSKTDSSKSEKSDKPAATAAGEKSASTSSESSSSSSKDSSSSTSPKT